MKIHIHTKTILTGLFTLLLALPFASCSDDDKGGTPVIHRVRTTDPGLKDSAFVQGVPEQMLVIEGENLGSTKKIYINDQDIYFNPHYVTSQTIIVTIPKNLELTGINPDLPKEIRVETAGGVATYRFHVLSPEPEITGLRASYPINAGNYFLIQGNNFYEIEKIVLEGEEGTNVEAIDYVVSPNYKIITIKMPAGVDQMGELVVYCAAGEAKIAYSTVVLPPTISTISSDMPIIGADFFITGSYFVDVEKVNINGEYDILADNLNVSATLDTIYLKLPSEPAVSGKITVTAAGGDTTSDDIFYPIEYVIANYDNVGSISWTGSIYEGDGQKPPYITTGKAGGVVENNVGAWSGWFGNVLTNIQFRDAIPGNTSVSNLVIRFECFITYPLQTINYQVMFGGDWDNAPSGYIPKSIASNKTEIGQWMSCEIPLSMIAVNARSYNDIKGMGEELGFFSKNGAEDVSHYEVYFDNFRMMIKK